LPVKKTLIVIVSAVLAAALIALIVVVSLVSDNTDVRHAAAREDTSAFGDRMSDKLSEALSATEETGRIDLTFGEEEFNLLLGAALRGANNEAVRGICVSVEDENSLSLALGVSWSGIKTVLRANITFAETDSSLVFSCTDMRMGKIKLSASAANSFVGKLIKQSALAPETFVKDKEWQIVFDKMTLADYLSGYLAGEDNLELSRIALERCFREEGMLGLRFGKDNVVGAEISLEKLAYEPLRDGEAYSDISAETLNAKLETLLNNDALSLANINLGAKYLAMGYPKLSDEEKQIIDELDFSSVGITSNSTYKGMISYDERTLGSIVVEHLPTVIPYTGEVFFKVTEEDINALVLQGDVIGSVAVFARRTESGYKVSSVLLESFNADISGDTLELKFVLSINGKQLLFSAIMESLPTHITSITISMRGVTMGGMEATDEESAAVFQMIKSVFAAQSWILCDQEAQTVTFDFESAIGDNWLLRLAFSTFGGMVTTSLEEEGYIKVSVQF